MRYLLLNGLVLMAVFVVFWHFVRGSHTRKNTIKALLVIVALTAVFDPLIIANGIVAYQETFILGVKWFGAPIEDFAYAVVAVLLVPLVWNYYEKK